MSASDTWIGDEFPNSTSTGLPGGRQPPGFEAPDAHNHADWTQAEAHGEGYQPEMPDSANPRST